MFLDVNPDRRWDEPMACKSCKRPILSKQSTEQLKMPFDPQNKLHELNGIYHSECARPYLSVVRAFNVLSGGSFFGN
jgi:hypothetical protein